MLFKGLPYIIMVNNKVRQPVGHELISCGFCIFAYRVEMYFAKFAGHFCFLFSEMTVGFFFLYFLKSNLFLVVLGEYEVSLGRHVVKTALFAHRAFRVTPVAQKAQASVQSILIHTGREQPPPAHPSALAMQPPPGYHACSGSQACSSQL